MAYIGSVRKTENHRKYNELYGVAHHESPIAQWLPSNQKDIWKVSSESAVRRTQKLF